MKLLNIVYVLIVALFVSSILLLRTQLGSYTIFHPVFLILLALFVLFPNKFPFNKVLKFDAIVYMLLIFDAFIIISYIGNINNINLVIQTYALNTGEHPSGLYYKIALNGLIYIAVVYLAYRLGKVFGTTKYNIQNICKVLTIICFINAFVNVIAWLISTHGIIGRYNFTPPLTLSPGISIQYSSLGFLLCLPIISKHKAGYKLYALLFIQAILLLSILIIQTRQSQITFVIMCVLYFALTIKFTIKKILVTIPFVLTGFIVIIVILAAIGSFDAYGTIDSAESTDVVIRVLMLQSAYGLFLANPVLGIGYGMFPGHNTTPIVVTGQDIYLGSPHNGLAAIVCELGLIGLLLYIILIISITIKMNSIRKSISQIELKKYVTAVFVFQFIMMMTFLISNSHLFGPPSEPPYLCMAFISWFMIGELIGTKQPVV
ncbi:MAG: O-antigen ligase family protein [Bacteroidota bacterium]